jgi:hypothetical protein
LIILMRRCELNQIYKMMQGHRRERKEDMDQEDTRKGRDWEGTAARCHAAVHAAGDSPSRRSIPYNARQPSRAAIIIGARVCSRLAWRSR